ncbi:MAG: FliM/FliN family flagellar motor switch protein [Sedimentisphaerales bacterium]|nr:FliM/FliN family flagellar motor switch protein [Sedimentisphaerales bacterium]
MPQTAQATPENAQEQGPNEAPAEADGRKVAQAAEFPEASEGQVSGSGGQFDILLDMDVPVTVVLGATQIPVRRLLQLGPGAVLKLDKSVGAPAELFLKDSKFAEADIVVVDDRFAVRIKQITGAAIAGKPTEG